MNWLQRILNLIGVPVTSLSADLEAVNDVTDDIVAVTAALPDAGALTSIAQADTLSLDIQGAGWATETLFAIQAAIEAIGGANSFVEVIPNIDFAKAAIPTGIVAPPPADPVTAANSILSIKVDAGHTFVLRSLWVNITAFGTGATYLIFKLWAMVNGTCILVDTKNVSDLGIQNLMDLFGIPEVCGEGIWVTVEKNAGGPADGACAGTYKYAIAE